MRGSYGQSLLQPYPQVKQALVAEEIHNASKLALGRIQGWAVAWNSARYNQQQAGLPLADLVRGDTLQRASLYLAASPVSLLPRRPAGARSSLPCATMAAWRASSSSTITRPLTSLSG